MTGLILKYIKPYRVMFVLGSAAKLLEAILELFLPVLMASIIDVGIVGGDIAYVYKMGINLFLISALGLASALYCQYSASVASQGLGMNIRDALMRKLSSFSYSELDKFSAATLINRITSDVNYVLHAVALTMRLVTRAPFLCAGAVIMALNIDVALSLIFIAVVPVLGMVLYFFMKITSPLYSRVQKRLDKTALVVRENLSGVRVIRAFSGAREEENRFRDAALELNDASFHAAKVSALMNPVTAAIVNAGIIAILYFGASRVYGGHLTQGSIFALSVYATKILHSLIIIANLAVLFTKATASSERINEIMDVTPSLVFPAQTTEMSPVGNDIAFEFCNVSFSYSESENVLSEISLKIKKGSILGIVGVTGSGKTTLINLLQRFYDATGGDIKIGGINVKNFSKKDLRSRIGVVPQTNMLFAGTIAENIRWGNAQASVEEVQAALETAQAMEFVKNLPDGIETIIQEGGKNFSGGQRQRLAIARAIVKRPSILIMDDSLSALDYKTDLLLRQSLRKNLSETTAVIVSQRISSVMNADVILVLNDGKISGKGAHGELLENCADYREIYESQLQSEDTA